MYVRPSAPQSIGGVVDDAIRLFNGSFRHTWKLSLGFSLVVALAFIPLTQAVPTLAAGRLPSVQSLHIQWTPVLVITYLLSILLEALFYGALFASENAVAQGVPLTAGQAIGTGLRRLPTVVIAGILFTLAFMGGCVLLIIPGIFLWGRLQLWPAALFTGNTGPGQALGNSWNLTKGHWWRTSTIVAVALILVYIVSIAVGILPATAIAAFGVQKGNLFQAQLVTLPFSILTRIVTAPAIVATLLAVHHDCRLRSGGDDLAERAAALSRV